MKEPIGYKLLLSYDVHVDSLQEYHQFVMSRYIPVLQSMGMRILEAWHTAYGNAPNRLIGFVCDDRTTVNELLTSDTWMSLNDQLQEYVGEFSYKVIPFRDGFQL